MFGFWLGVGKLKNASSQNIRLIKKSKTRKIDKRFKKGKWAKEDKKAPANKIRIFWQIKKRHLPHVILFFFFQKWWTVFDFSEFSNWKFQWKQRVLIFLSRFFVIFECRRVRFTLMILSQKPDTNAFTEGPSELVSNLLQANCLWFFTYQNHTRFAIY